MWYCTADTGGLQKIDEYDGRAIAEDARKGGQGLGGVRQWLYGVRFVEAGENESEAGSNE